MNNTQNDGINLDMPARAALARLVELNATEVGEAVSAARSTATLRRRWRRRPSTSR